jgi:hypothetical protein
MLATARGAIVTIGKTDGLRLEGRNTPPFSITLTETLRLLASSTRPKNKMLLGFAKPLPVLLSFPLLPMSRVLDKMLGRRLFSWQKLDIYK